MRLSSSFPRTSDRVRTAMLRRVPRPSKRKRASPSESTHALGVGRFIPLIGAAAFIALWQLITALDLYPSFIIPPPIAVFERFIEVARNGTLWLHTATTLLQVVIGLAVGGAVGFALGVIVAKNQHVEKALSPLIVTLQSTPVVAYAPLLVIWFGSGITSKIITCALIVFFPILMNTVVGLRSVPEPLRELMRSMSATRWQMFVKLEVPAALPVLLGGLKVSATLAVIGAVVGEFVGAEAGLGRLINIARNDFDTPLQYVAVFMLAVIARLMYGVVAWLERHLLAWQQ